MGILTRLLPSCRNIRCLLPCALPIPTSLLPQLYPQPAHRSVLRQALEGELRSHQVVCADIEMRGRDLGARGPLTGPDPRECAEAVQDLWQQLRAQVARQSAWLQAALLVQKVSGW